jgi:hypothetical protein
LPEPDHLTYLAEKLCGMALVVEIGAQDNEALAAALRRIAADLLAAPRSTNLRDD